MKQAAIGIVQKLREAGFSSYFVGGCVRDQVMGRDSKDYDIATSARPEQVMNLFTHTVPIGVQFGVVLVLVDGRSYEVATFRSDGIYPDGRHPREVVYTDDARLDVLRRDFTINGLLYDPLSDEVLDFVGGLNDIHNAQVRTIGDPAQRFREDKLRLIRAVRFASRFNFRLEPHTAKAIEAMADQIVQVSNERLREELIKILTEGFAHPSFQLLDAARLLRPILPEIADLQGVEQPPEFHPEGDVWRHTLLMLRIMDETRHQLELGNNPTATDWAVVGGVAGEPAPYPPLTLAMGVLLHDVGKPATFEVKDRIRFNNHCEEGARLAVRICERFRFTNRQTERIVHLVRDHLKFKDLPQMRPSTLKRFLRQEGFDEHLELHRLDCLGSHRHLDMWCFAKQKREELKPDEMLPIPLISGDDLIELGYRPGPVFKDILKSVEDAQLDLVLRTREEALQWVESRFPKPQPRQE